MKPGATTARRADGVKVPYQRTAGDRPLLLVPGLGNGARLFGTLPRTLARRGWSVLTYDPPGLGRAAGCEVKWSFDRAVDDLAAVLDAESIACTTLAATSMGGKIALAFAARYPDRVDRLVLYGTESVGGARSRAVYEMFEVAFRELGPADLSRLLVPFLFGHTFLEENGRVVADMVRAWSPSEAERRTTLLQVDALLGRDFAACLSSVRARVVCHAGLEDTLVDPTIIRKTVDRLADAQLIEVPRAGHSMMLENPGAALAALEQF